MISKDKFIAAVMLHALGDTIGFKNGQWEFYGQTEFIRTKRINYNLNNEMLYEFINLGGINNINLSNWFVSDDTLLHIDLMQAYSKTSNLQQVIKLIIAKFIKTKQKYYDATVNINRQFGITTIKSIQSYEKSSEHNYQNDYDDFGGGNGAAMRNICIGLVFNDKKNINDLIEHSIQTSKLTHNNPIGFLGGLTTSFFTQLAINNTNINEWPFKLLELLKSSNVMKYITTSCETKDYNKFVGYWHKYVDAKFDDSKNPITKRSHANLQWRTQFHYDNFSDPSLESMAGANGCSVNIMAYDALLDSQNVWEKLVIYSMIHIGDSDTVGAIAGGWYGALNGFQNIPQGNMEFVEFKSKLQKLALNLYDKYAHHK